jgi:anti-sigma factor RsiW
MKECWEDGSLRAFLDRELPPDESAELRAHLDECEQCRVRSLILSARADRVSGLVGSLAEPATPAVAAFPFPRPRRNYWAAAVIALAAGWAAFVLLTPRHVEAPPTPQVAHVSGPALAQGPPVISPEVMPARRVAQAPVVHRSNRRAFPAAVPRATLAGFTPLDNDPIDAGVIMRVLLAEGHMQADVVYSPDGRPRAIRLVGSTAGN